jgi:hypothetical protein
MMGQDSYENPSCGVEQVLRTHGHLGGNIYHATWRKLGDGGSFRKPRMMFKLHCHFINIGRYIARAIW